VRTKSLNPCGGWSKSDEDTNQNNNKKERRRKGDGRKDEGVKKGKMTVCVIKFLIYYFWRRRTGLTADSDSLSLSLSLCQYLSD